MRSSARFLTGAFLLVLGLLVLASAVFATAWATGQETQAHPSQQELYKIGTEGPGGSFTDVKQRDVIIPPTKKNPGQMAVSYAERALGGVAECSAVGIYNPRTAEIFIVGEQERFEAGLSIDFRPNLSRTLRHEYGHAAFFQWAREEGLYLTSDLFLALLDPSAEPTPDAYPQGLAPVVAEWEQQPEDVYGADYFTSTFVEYTAESYGRFLGGESIPPKTRDFMVTAYGGETAE